MKQYEATRGYMRLNEVTGSRHEVTELYQKNEVAKSCRKTLKLKEMIKVAGKA